MFFVKLWTYLMNKIPDVWNFCNQGKNLFQIQVENHIALRFVDLKVLYKKEFII